MAASASAASAMPCDMGAMSKWASLSFKWRPTFLISADQPHLGSWLDVQRQPWGIGCKACCAAKISSPWASFAITNVAQLQKINMQKHQESKAHKAAVKVWLKEGGCVGPNPSAAPSLCQFEEFMDAFSKKTALSQKELQMAWCLAEGLRALDQKFISKASQVALMRDERHGRLAIRFRAVAPDLSTRSGFLGQARQAGTGGDNLSLATWQVMKRACSRFVLAPLGRNPGHLKKALFQHMRSKIVALCADSASDEMASAEILRSATLSLAPDNQPMLPNLQHVFRDRAHASRRLTSRAWNADGNLQEVMNYMCRGPRSIAKLINNSIEIKRIFAEHCRTSETTLASVLSSFRAAGHRFESHARPLGRTCLFFHACVKTALHITKTRTDGSAKTANQWLLWISEERVLQAAMLADAADSSLALTRSLDSENVDPAQLKGELRRYLCEIRSLFVEGRCTTAFGFTSTVLNLLKSPIVFQVAQELRTLGCCAGVDIATVKKCLGRMQAWVVLAATAIEAEFPHFEIAQAFEVFNLRGIVAGSTDAQLRTLAHTYKLDFARLKAQWQDLYPRAQLEYKEQLGVLTNSHHLSQKANKDAWKITLERYSCKRSSSHPADALSVALQNYFCCTPSTSGIEQNFSLGQSRYTKQRHHAKPGNEELVLKLFFDLPHQTKEEKQEICKLARVCWAAQYGCPREHAQGKFRADKGMKRPAEDKALTETAFLKRRRSAAAAAAEACSGATEQIDANYFQEGHRKEIVFFEKKQLSRRIQAVAEESFPDATAQDRRNVEAASAKFVNRQMQKRKQVSRAMKLTKGKDRDAVLQQVAGSKAFVAASANMSLTAALANHRLQLTSQASDALVIVCDKPGEGLAAPLQILVGLRGLFEISPNFFLSGDGCALKYQRAASARKVVLVSAACAQKHQDFWRAFREMLPARHGWQLHRMRPNCTLQQLLQKQSSYPKYKAYAVIHEEERTAQVAGNKNVYTVHSFLHRLRRADLVASCSGLLQVKGR